MLGKPTEKWMPSTPGASLQNDIFFAIQEQSPTAAARFAENCQVDLDVQPMNVQISTINNYWRLAIGGLARNTIPQREALVDGVSREVWIANFNTHIRPLVVETWS